MFLKLKVIPFHCIIISREGLVVNSHVDGVGDVGSGSQQTQTGVASQVSHDVRYTRKVEVMVCTESC